MKKRHILPLLIVLAGIAGVIYLFKYVSKEEVIAATLIHLLAGTLVAFLSLFLILVFFRPKIAISSLICHRDNHFWFKVVNMSRYHAFDIKLELFKMVPVNHSGAKSNVDIYKISLRTSDWTSINRFRDGHSEKDPFSLFAQHVFTEQDISKSLMQAGTYLVLQITARHGLTGLADRFTQEFADESVIRESHKFCFGSSLDTMPINKTF